jgi:hypothetical protein
MALSERIATKNLDHCKKQGIIKDFVVVSTFFIVHVPGPIQNPCSKATWLFGARRRVE